MGPKERRKELKLQIEALDEKISAASVNRPIRLGIFGTRASGKSSLLASWYLFQLSREFDITLEPDELTMDYLDSVSETLLESGSTEATPVTEPETLRFTFECEGETWPFETIDFPGVFLRPTRHKDAQDDAATTRQFLRRCDVMICLFDWKDRSIETLNALNLIQGCSAHFILALTKFDECGPFPETVDELEQRLKRMEEENRTLADLRFKLEKSFSTGGYSVVPVSALGADFTSPNAPAQPPLTRDDLRPFNIYRPLIKAVQHMANGPRALIEQRDTLIEQLAEVQAEIDDDLARQGERPRENYHPGKRGGVW